MKNNLFFNSKSGLFNPLLGMVMAPLMAIIMGIRSMAVEEGSAKTTKDDEQKALLTIVETKVKEVIAESQKESVKKEDVDARIKEINDLVKDMQDQTIKELKDRVDALAAKNEILENASKDQGAELTKLKNNEGPDTPILTFREAVKQAILEKKELMVTEKDTTDGSRMSILDYFTEKGNKTSPIMKIPNGMDILTNKVAVDMLQSNIVQNYAQYMRMAQLDPNRVSIPLTIYRHALDILPSKGVSRPTMSLLVVYSYEDGSGTKTEGSASSKSSFLLKTVEFKAFNIATHFVLSDETLDDLEEALDEIGITAPDKILDKIDSKVFADAGDGTTDIMGLLVNGTTCTDFDTTDYEDSVVGGNMVDMIAKMKLAANKVNYRLDTIIMNGTDIDNVQCLKDLLNNSISDRRLVFDAAGNLVRVAGLAVVQNDQITANTCLALDSKQVMIGVRKALTLEIGLNSSDFTEGQKTIRLGVRLALGVRDKAALIYSTDMETDKDAIVQVSA